MGLILGPVVVEDWLSFVIMQGQVTGKGDIQRSLFSLPVCHRDLHEPDYRQAVLQKWGNYHWSLKRHPNGFDSSFPQFSAGIST